jgi:predicted DNA-binding protein with PD1-like motif
MKTSNTLNQRSSLSRRQWIRTGLTTCGYLAAGGLVTTRADDRPPLNGYTRPGPVVDRGRAPGMQARLIAENPGGERTYAVIFGKGDEILSGLTEFAEREKLVGGHFTAIGALQSARFGWFDAAQKAYRDIPVDQQVELIALIGDVGLVNGAPQIHAHGTVGLPDGQVRGGHLLQALAWPTLEVFITSSPVALVKERDDETNLFLFELGNGKPA